MAKSFHPSRLQRFGLVVLLVPGICLFSWLGVGVATQGNYLVGGVFAALAAVVAHSLMFNLTMRVDLDEHSLTRSWLFGRTVVPIDSIRCLRLGRERATTILSIHYGRKKFILLTGNALARKDLQEIHGDLLAGAIAAHGLEGQPLIPQFSEHVGYIDIAGMIEAKPR